MKIYALQTGTVRCKQFQLTGASFLSRIYQFFFTNNWGEWMPTYCWLIEHSEGNILVDTGETIKIMEKGFIPEGDLYHKAAQSRIKPEEEILQQLAKIGFQPKDISTLILTHLHGDHIGGLSFFEHCKIYVGKKEYELASSKKGKKNGYYKNHWPKWFQPELITYTDGAEGNFSTSQKITADGKVLVVPTPGHSIGHHSILVKNEDFTTIIAGDLSYNEQTLKQEIPDVILMNRTAKKSVKKMHQYVKNNPSIYLSSHDWNAIDNLEKSKIFG